MNPVSAAMVFGMLIPVLVIVGGLVIAGLAVHHKARLRELAYRERIAMIEKGLVPPPENDPARFEQVLSAVSARISNPSLIRSRHRSAGVLLLGIGVSLGVMLYFVTGEPPLAYGVGSMLAILGVAFLINSVISYRDGGTPSAP